jgi:hypothetical protein
VGCLTDPTEPRAVTAARIRSTPGLASGAAAAKGGNTKIPSGEICRYDKLTVLPRGIPGAAPGDEAHDGNVVSLLADRAADICRRSENQV